MKKHIKVVLTLLVALSFAAIVSAEDATHEGTISSVNTIANTFDLKTKSETISLYVRPMSHMKINGENKPLSAIPSGSEAKCTVYMKSDRLTVRDCIVTPKQ
ncbi:MAG: hypothetical protein AAB275_06735 [Deltaproteobacteria bacterium]